VSMCQFSKKKAIYVHKGDKEYFLEALSKEVKDRKNSTQSSTYGPLWSTLY